MYELNEQDWKMYKNNIANWQERYIAKLLDEYKDIIDSSSSSATKFWTLEKRINKDKKCSGVVIELRRSAMVEQIIDLVINKVITFDDLLVFSKELQDYIKDYLKGI